MKLFKEILKEKSHGKYRYSQGRVYLLIFIFVYLGVLGYTMFKTYKCRTVGETIDLQAEQMILDSIKWALGVFALYVLGGKAVTHFSPNTKTLVQGKDDIKPEDAPKPNEKQILTENEDGPPI